MHSANRSGSRFSVSEETSAKTGRAPWYSTQFAVAAKVSGEVIASSPGFNPAANAAPCRAAVPELKATAYFAPTHAATASSNSATFGPVVNQSERSTSTTAWMSSSEIEWRPYGSIVWGTGGPPSTAG